MNHGLSDDSLAEIHRVLERRPEVEAAILYGSRAKGTHRPGSDIDLALLGSALESRTLAEIARDFEDGRLPWRVDVSILQEIRHPELLDHIRRVGITLYQKEPVAAPCR